MGVSVPKDVQKVTANAPHVKAYNGWGHKQRNPAKERPQPDAEPPPITNIQPCALRSHASLSEASAARNGQDEGPWEFKGQTWGRGVQKLGERLDELDETELDENW